MLNEETNAMTEVRLSRISKNFGNVGVVRNISFEIHEGEFLVLVGPSGCGKTTILRMIAGLEPITSGELYIGDRLANDISPKDRDIAMVFQNYALYPNLSVYDNIASILQWRGMSRQEIALRVTAAAEMLEIGPCLQRRPQDLSDGQRHRVSLARVIVSDSSIVLMDEPLSSLDAKLRVQTRSELAHLHRQFPRTTLYVTHDQEEAMTLGDRIIVLFGGVIQQIGTADDLYTKPANQFVAGFIGTPAMNFFHKVRVTYGEAGPWVQINDQYLKLPTEIADVVASVKSLTITIGIRPEDLDITRDTTCVGNILHGKVEIVESLGNEILLHLQIGLSSVLARVKPSSSIQIGDEVNVIVNTQRLHVFDPHTMEALV
jgi:multiple sugar transport system ATP-binding protein